jgi:hypothetical protein
MCECIHLTRINCRVCRQLGDVSPSDVTTEAEVGWTCHRWHHEARVLRVRIPFWELAICVTSFITTTNDITASGQLPRDGFVILTQLFRSRLWLFFGWKTSSARTCFISLRFKELAAIWRHNALVTLNNFSIFRNDLFLSRLLRVLLKIFLFLFC